MIISDNELHKIDVRYNDDGFLQISAFHLPNKNSSEWNFKLIGLSPEAQSAIVKFITDHNKLTNSCKEKRDRITSESKN